MQLTGLTIQIAGSTDKDVDPRLLVYAHELIRCLVTKLFEAECSFVIGLGKEPEIINDNANLPQIFDWVIADTVNQIGIQRGIDRWDVPRLYMVGTVKTERQVPPTRRELWENLKRQDCLEIEYVESGWVSGAVRRIKTSRRGDILIAIGGGEGVEHLAQQYVLEGKPVLALDLELGASCRDGNGGAPALAKRLISRPGDFLRTSDSSSLGRLLTKLSTKNGSTQKEDVVSAIVDIIGQLLPPTAFYVRLLDPKAKEYGVVSSFFENIVTPTVTAAGYAPYQMGTVDSESSWMNEQIFVGLRYSGLVIADFTGLRPNCFIELGFALGLSKRLLITARNQTPIPFDIAPVETHFWGRQKNSRRIELFQAYWKRNINRHPLISERRLP